VSCHFIGYTEKSKVFRFYCPNRHTKYVEMRHTIFLEDKMIRGSIVPQEISLEEKWVHMPTPMIHELISSVLVQEYISPTFKVGSLSTTPNENGAPVIQEREVPNVVIDEEEDQPQKLKNNVSNQEY
jgi:hypothetical protein